MRKATWVTRWLAGDSVTRSVGLDSAHRISVQLTLTYPHSETGRPFRLDLSPEDAQYLAHRLLFHVNAIERQQANEAFNRKAVEDQ